MADQLVPVFIPPLGNLLAAAEKSKGSPLTRQDVEKIRDSGVCMMMEAGDAQKMAESRGFVDVNPENCWADWHRLRPQLFSGQLPQIVLCVPGGADLRARCEPILREAKIEHEFRGPEPSMVRAFRASSMTWPSLSEDDFARIDSHASVLYVLSDHIVPANAVATTSAILRIGQMLLDAGGFAIKCESSGIAHSADRWRGFNEIVERRDGLQWVALFDAYVQRPIATRGDLYSCGMHLLGLPDMIVSESILRGADAKTAPAVVSNLFRVFGTYLLGECPVGRFASGHTFSQDAQSQRFRLIWEPCAGYAPDDFFFNPFGRWRFTAV